MPRGKDQVEAVGALLRIGRVRAVQCARFGEDGDAALLMPLAGRVQMFEKRFGGLVIVADGSGKRVVVMVEERPGFGNGGAAAANHVPKVGAVDRVVQRFRGARETWAQNGERPVAD